MVLTVHEAAPRPETEEPRGHVVSQSPRVQCGGGQRVLQLVRTSGVRPEDIYNMDEIGHTTVHKPSKLVSTCGKRQVGAITSDERGSNTTGVYCENAAGVLYSTDADIQAKTTSPRQ